MVDSNGNDKTYAVGYHVDGSAAVYFAEADVAIAASATTPSEGQDPVQGVVSEIAQALGLGAAVEF